MLNLSDSLRKIKDFRFPFCFVHRFSLFPGDFCFHLFYERHLSFPPANFGFHLRYEPLFSFPPANSGFHLCYERHFPFSPFQFRLSSPHERHFSFIFTLNPISPQFIVPPHSFYATAIKIRGDHLLGSPLYYF